MTTTTTNDETVDTVICGEEINDEQVSGHPFLCTLDAGHLGPHRDQEEPMPSAWVAAGQAAVMLGLTPYVVLGMAERGMLRNIRIYGRRYVSLEDVEQMRGDGTKVQFAIKREAQR